MCFLIDGTKPWAETKVYKVVLDWNYIVEGSQIFHSLHKGFVYQAGKTYTLRVGAEARTGERTHEGYYVYRTLEAAKRGLETSEHRRGVIVELEVNPTDFIYHDVDNEVATYSRVKFLGKLEGKEGAVGWFNRP